MIILPISSSQTLTIGSTHLDASTPEQRETNMKDITLRWKEKTTIYFPTSSNSIILIGDFNYRVDATSSTGTLPYNWAHNQLSKGNWNLVRDRDMFSYVVEDVNTTNNPEHTFFGYVPLDIAIDETPSYKLKYGNTEVISNDCTTHANTYKKGCFQVQSKLKPCDIVPQPGTAVPRGGKCFDFGWLDRVVFRSDIRQHQSNFLSPPTPLEHQRLPVVIGDHSPICAKFSISYIDGVYDPNSAISTKSGLLDTMKTALRQLSEGQYFQYFSRSPVQLAMQYMGR